MSAERIRRGLDDLARVARLMAPDAELVAEVARLYTDVLRGGGTLFFAGNGGSAADAQHLATEYVVRFRLERAPLRAVALTTDSSLLTAAANDLGFEQIFARQIEALADARDLLVVHSTSGASPNLVRAVEAAKARSMTVVGFLGRNGGPLRTMVDLAVVIPSADTARIQELHLTLEHLIVDLVEESLGRA